DWANDPIDRRSFTGYAFTYANAANDEKLAHHQKYCSNQYVDRETTEGNVISDEWRDELQVNNLRNVTTNAHRAAREAYEMRDMLSSYFLTLAGEIPWQYDYVQRGQYHDAI
ncbi:hypothetical protein ALC57_06161, partial [Trachymyrmex cornetzi]